MTKKQFSISALSPNKQLAFGLLVFERMLPSLVTFSRDTGFDDSCCLKATGAAWSALQGGRDDVLDPPLSEACLKNAPDTEDFSHQLTSSALNAVLAISDIVEFALDGHLNRITNVSTLATDSVYLYLSSLEPPMASSSGQEERISSHPLMQQELRQEAASSSSPLCRLASITGQFRH